MVRLHNIEANHAIIFFPPLEELEPCYGRPSYPVHRADTIASFSHIIYSELFYPQSKNKCLCIIGKYLKM